MAIRLVTGLPGSGKTYYCVNHIVKKYCKSFGNTYALHDNIVLITNIDHLALESFALEEMVAKVGSVKKFFTLEYQQKIVDHFKGKSIVYVIDEAQKYFDRKFYDRGVFGFLESHRHLGFDIWLVAQNANLLAKDVLSLAEYELRAVPRTLSVLGLSYTKRIQGQIIGKEVLKKSKNVFALYCSQIGQEQEKIKTPFLKYAGAFILCLFLGFVMYRFTFASWGSIDKKVIPSTTTVVAAKHSAVGSHSNKDITFYSLRRVNFIHCNGNIVLFDWTLNQFVPMESFTFPLVAESSSTRLVLYAKIPIK